jgi:hypothetical protein
MKEHGEYNQSSPFLPLIQEIGKLHPNYLTMAEALIESSKQLVRGIGDEGEADLLLQRWKLFTQNGTNINAPKEPTSADFQSSLEIISVLSHGNRYTFNIPGSAGMMRIGFIIEVDDRISVEMVDSGRRGQDKQDVIRRFESIKP